MSTFCLAKETLSCKIGVPRPFPISFLTKYYLALGSLIVIDKLLLCLWIEINPVLIEGAYLLFYVVEWFGVPFQSLTMLLYVMLVTFVTIIATQSVGFKLNCTFYCYLFVGQARSALKPFQLSISCRWFRRRVSWLLFHGHDKLCNGCRS